MNHLLSTCDSRHSVYMSSHAKAERKLFKGDLT